MRVVDRLPASQGGGAIVTLRLGFLGPFHATKGSQQPLRLPSRKAQALLAYLCVEADRSHYREALSGLLWPNSTDQAARSSLRQALRDLRQAIGGDPESVPYLLASREMIQLDPAADISLDVAAFEKATEALLKRPHAIVSDKDAQAIEAAITLVRGPFLDGFSLGDSPAFEEWLLLRREQLNRRMLMALEAVAIYHEEHGRLDEALSCVRRVIDLEPWREEAHQQAMHLLVSKGRRSEALAQYVRCRDVLMRDLGAAPGQEITTLYERICDGTLTVPSSQPRTRARSPSMSPWHTVGAEIPPQLVAREQELAKLDGLLAQSVAGRGRVALITGDTGSGKTALMQGFARRAMAQQDDLLVALGGCSAQGGAGDTYQPFREVLETLTGDPDIFLDTEHQRRIGAVLALAFETLAAQGSDLVRLLAHDPELLARARACAPDSDTWPARLEASMTRVEDSAAKPQPTALCEQLTRVLRTIARNRPLLVILDDLQWADAPSLDMLFYLGRHLDTSHILILGAYRDGPGRAPALGSHAVQSIADEFQRQWGDVRVDLAEIDGRRFVDAYLDSWPNRLESSFRQTLADHTGGNPLFTVELVRAMQERGDLIRDGNGRWTEGPRLAWEWLPPRAEGAISQRIGQLTDAQQELLEAASVEGEQFHAEVLARALGLSTQSVIGILSGPLGRQAHLVAAQSLARVCDQEWARYRFRHNMFQSYLYGRLDPIARAHLHEAVATALEELGGEQAPQLAGKLAWHLEEAGQGGRAARYLLEAGRQAARLGADGQATACFERALGLLQQMPSITEWAKLELALQMALDGAVLSGVGWGAAKRLGPLSRAYQLGQQIGQSSPAALYAVQALADLSVAQNDSESAIRLVEQLLQAGEQLDEPLYVASAHTMLAFLAAKRGDLDASWEHVSKTLAFFANPPRELTEEEVRPLRPQVDVLAMMLLLARGQLDRAKAMIERTLASGTMATPRSTATLQIMAAYQYALRHDDRLAREWAERGLETLRDRGSPEIRAWGEVVLGWAEARSGENKHGIDRIVAALDAQSWKSAAPVRCPQMIFLTEAYLAAGETEKAAQVVEEALQEIEQTDSRFFESELTRLYGEILLQDEHADDCGIAQRGEACFRRAVEITQQQGAPFWELRATTSLARLWAQTDRRREAVDAVHTILGAFTEGFDAPDLVDAATLLADLEADASRAS